MSFNITKVENGYVVQLDKIENYPQPRRVQEMYICVTLEEVFDKVRELSD
jgi:hypothetical protein